MYQLVVVADAAHSEDEEDDVGDGDNGGDAIAGVYGARVFGGEVGNAHECEAYEGYIDDYGEEGEATLSLALLEEENINEGKGNEKQGDNEEEVVVGDGNTQEAIDAISNDVRIIEIEEEEP